MCTRASISTKINATMSSITSCKLQPFKDFFEIKENDSDGVKTLKQSYKRIYELENLIKAEKNSEKKIELNGEIIDIYFKNRKYQNEEIELIIEVGDAAEEKRLEMRKKYPRIMYGIVKAHDDIIKEGSELIEKIGLCINMVKSISLRDEYEPKFKKILGNDFYILLTNLLPPEILKEQLEKLLELCAKYKPQYDFVKFETTDNTNSMIKGKALGETVGIEYKDIKMNRISDESGENKWARYKSRCDEDEIDFTVLAHEFGHVILAGIENIINDSNNKLYDFAKEVKDIHKEYRNEIKIIRQKEKDTGIEDEELWNKIDLGNYALLHGIDEFFAEAFKEYVLTKNPDNLTKYAKEVGKIIEKYAKR